MKSIKIKTPAKINLTLEVLNKRTDGFHNIHSIMQTVNLYDTLTFSLENCKGVKIGLKGNSTEIPYDEKNLVYKSAVKFFDKAKINNCNLLIDIEKNIPVSAGLAGGSSNAAGTFFALNKIFNNPLTEYELNELCAQSGSDINFCMKGGCAFCSSRGEVIEQIPAFIQKISLIKPKNLGISAKEAYEKFSLLKDKSNPANTIKLKNLLLNKKFDCELLYNSLENALFPYYPELKKVKDNVKNSLMSGSGAAFFVLSEKIETNLDRNNYDIFENLETTSNGIIYD